MFLPGSTGLLRTPGSLSLIELPVACKSGCEQKGSTPARKRRVLQSITRSCTVDSRSFPAVLSGHVCSFAP